jgi:hypothetical protein
MTTRTTQTKVTFTRPFVLTCFGEPLPAGTYDVEVNEQFRDGDWFPVYRRAVALLYLHIRPERPSHRQILSVDQDELDAVLERDEAKVGPPAPPEFTADALEGKIDAPSERDGGRSSDQDEDDAVMVRWCR